MFGAADGAQRAARRACSWASRSPARFARRQRASRSPASRCCWCTRRASRGSAATWRWAWRWLSAAMLSASIANVLQADRDRPRAAAADAARLGDALRHADRHRAGLDAGGPPVFPTVGRVLGRHGLARAGRLGGDLPALFRLIRDDRRRAARRTTGCWCSVIAMLISTLSKAIAGRRWRWRARCWRWPGWSSRSGAAGLTAL